LPKTNAAVLIVSGELDPVNPPDWGASVARALPNARQVVIPESAHLFIGLSGVDTCFDPMVLRFFATGDVKHLDTSCVAKMSPPPFK
jgi:pimeloyl-ACP methyl ester carboxylesterase